MTKKTKLNLLALLGVLLIALNLRSPFTSLAPVLGQIMQDLSLPASMAGFLTALPLLSFAVFSPLAPKLSNKLGLFPSLLLALFFIGVGIVLRSVGGSSALYFGTVLIGAGIATGNVLLPVVVKMNFPTKISLVTSIYIFAMGVASTLSASVMVPVSNLEFLSLSGWQLALMVNLLFPVLALVVWIPEAKRKARDNGNETVQQGENVPMIKLIKCPVAWQVTLAIGLNSFTFYSFAGWLPTILSDLSYSELDAGYIYGFLQFSTMIPGLLLIPVLARTQSQRTLITLCAALVIVGALGLVLLPQYAVFWVGLYGLANCSTFIIALSFVGLRTSTPSQAAALSGLSQSIGYALAATGPTLVGQLHTMTNSWAVPLLSVAVVATCCTVFANLAARDVKVTV